MARTMKTVMGVCARAPRITGRAIWLVTVYIALPLIVWLVAFDVLVWWIADQVWGVCVAVWCFF